MQRELEMSLNHVDGGKLKLEQLLQCEVEQQQVQNHIRRTATLANGLINRVVGPMPGPSVLQVLNWTAFPPLLRCPCLFIRNSMDVLTSRIVKCQGTYVSNLAAWRASVSDVLNQYCRLRIQIAQMQDMSSINPFPKEVLEQGSLVLL